MTVDFSADPAGAAEALDRAGERLDGMVVRVEGIDVVPSSSRRVRDLDSELSQIEPERFDFPECLAGLLQERVRAGETLGCAALDGVRPESPLATRLEASLTSALLSMTERPISFEPQVSTEPRADGLLNVTVDVGGPDQIGSLEDALAPTSVGVQEFLFLIAISDAKVAAVSLESGGSCMAFAAQLGGDQCTGYVTAAEIEGFRR